MIITLLKCSPVTNIMMGGKSPLYFSSGPEKPSLWEGGVSPMTIYY